MQAAGMCHNGSNKLPRCCQEVRALHLTVFLALNTSTLRLRVHTGFARWRPWAAA